MTRSARSTLLVSRLAQSQGGACVARIRGPDADDRAVRQRHRSREGPTGVGAGGPTESDPPAADIALEHVRARTCARAHLPPQRNTGAAARRFRERQGEGVVRRLRSPTGAEEAAL